MGYVRLHDLHTLELFEALHGKILLIMSPEVFDILGVGEVLLLCIFTVELFEVMDLIFIFNVTMMARSESKVGEPGSVRNETHPVVATDDARVGGIKDAEDFAKTLQLAILCHSRIGLVVHAVGLAHFLRGPHSRGIVIVEGEEGGGIEGIDVMFLYERTQLNQ